MGLALFIDGHENQAQRGPDPKTKHFGNQNRNKLKGMGKGK